MKYTPIFVPLLMILAFIAVSLYRPPPNEIAVAAPKVAIVCDSTPYR
jgi:hypothetical protein